MKKYALIAILVLAAVLRLWNISAGDITGNDEVLYAFRAIGMMDFDEAEFQTTPLEWFDPNIPWWTNLSFHDHPPLVFLIQSFFMKIFGESVFAFRLPSALFGIASVYLVYLIGLRLFSKNAALLAAALTAITVNHVYISRIGIQESYVIFFLLLTSYLFLESLDEDKYLPWTGVVFGFALLTKYTTGVLLPIFLTYLLLRKREYFANKKFWLGALFSLLIFSPVIVYNIQLYRAVGHFDFQISYILHQNPQVWQKAPGKEEIGTFADRLRNFLPNLFKSNSWLFLAIFFLTIPAFAIMALRKSPVLKQKIFLDIALVYLILLLLFIGPTARFLTMLTPFLALKIAFFGNLALSHPKARRLVAVALVVIALFEILYSINSQVTYYPIGPQFWTWSKLRYDNYNWGYNELDSYLEKELSGKMPFLALNLRYKFLDEAQNNIIAEEKALGLERYPALIIYDYNFNGAAQLWSMERLQIYHGWPVLKTEAYLEMLKENGADFFDKAGIKIHYFIRPTEKLPLKRGDKLTLAGVAFEKQLLRNGFSPLILKNKRGEEVFHVYKF